MACRYIQHGWCDLQDCTQVEDCAKHVAHPPQVLCATASEEAYETLKLGAQPVLHRTNFLLTGDEL